MSLLIQWGVLIFTMLIGTILKGLIPIPVPATVYGMIILFILLKSGLVKVEDIEPVSAGLLGVLAFLFVPAGVGMINEFDTLRGHILTVFGAIFLSNLITLFVTGHVVQFIQKKKKEK